MVKKNKSKKIIFSILISLLIVQLSIPVYAPARRPDYIDYMPLVAVADLSLNYTRVGILNIGPNSINLARSVLDMRSSGVVNVTTISDPTIWNIFPFNQRMALSFVIDETDEDIIGVSGRSNLTIFTPAGITSFTGTIVGTANYQDLGGWMELSLRFTGSASKNLFISLDITGNLTKADVTAERIDFEYDLGDGFTATGKVLTLETSPSR